MKNLPVISLVLNLILAVAVLFYLHFSNASPKAAAPAVAIASSEPATEDTLLQNAPVPVIANMGADAKVVYVQYDSLITNYDFYKKIQRDLEAKLKSAEAELMGKQAKLEKDYADYQEKQSLYTDAMKQEKEQQLMAQNQELTELKQKREQQFAEQQKALSEKLLNSLSGYIKRIAKQNKFDYVLSYQRGVPGVLYGKDSLDITSTVIEGLNKEYRK